MYIRKAEVYNHNKENPNVIGLECDIYKFLLNCQCAYWKGAKGHLKQNQEKSKIAFKNSEICDHIISFKSDCD